MAALTPAVAEILPPTDGSGNFITGLAGATIVAGNPLYLDSVTNTYKLADSNASQATAQAVGIALHAALAGQPIRMQGGRGGFLTIGATAAITVGIIYCVGATAGTIVPSADLAATDYVSILAVGATLNRLAIDIFVSNQVKP